MARPTGFVGSGLFYPGNISPGASLALLPTEPVSAWKITGVVTGDGDINGYRWVGGVPTATVIDQDPGASTWAVAVSMVGNELVVTVTGESGETIDWRAKAKLVQVPFP